MLIKIKQTETKKYIDKAQQDGHNGLEPNMGILYNPFYSLMQQRKLQPEIPFLVNLSVIPVTTFSVSVGCSVQHHKGNHTKQVTEEDSNVYRHLNKLCFCLWFLLVVSTVDTYLIEITEYQIRCWLSAIFCFLYFFCSVTATVNKLENLKFVRMK